MTTPKRTLTAPEKIMRARKRGERSEISERRLRKMAHGRKEFFHRAKNGVYDPITYFHIVEALLTQGSGAFRTRDLVERLTNSRPQLAWDATTVGRVLSDLSETLNEANGTVHISTARRWNGMLYAVTPNAETRAVLLRLIDDLMVLSEELVAAERENRAPSRMNSPLQRCPSVE